MKRATQVLAAGLLIGIGLYSGSVWSSKANGVLQSNQPGSVNDPVVTKSYVDEVLRSLGTGGAAAPSGTAQQPAVAAAEIRKMIEEEIRKLTPSPAQPTQPATPPATGSNSDAALVVIQMKPGQTIMGGIGTEMIVRTGKAFAYSNSDNGIPNVTAGKDLANGTEIPINHLLVFPREGRGLRTDAKDQNPVFVMVRGPYLLLNADGSTATP